MPEYTYKCNACMAVYDRRHSIKERLIDCEVCEAIGTLVRIPSLPLVVKKATTGGKISAPGRVVKEVISDAKEDLKREKDDLTKREQ